jgi:hypothetical protein
MRVMRIKYLTILLLLIGVYACSSFPYAKTNRQYIRQAKLLSKKMSISPDKQSENQLPLAENWVGTTNFMSNKTNVDNTNLYYREMFFKKISGLFVDTVHKIKKL